MAKNRKNDIDSFRGLFLGMETPEQEQLKGQESIETLEGGKYMPTSAEKKLQEKETKTVEEFKQFKEYLEQRATEHFEEHKKAFERWKFGEIDKIWIDKDGFICIQYDGGDWWHYNEQGEWW